jgi:hypothetical protein
MPQIDHAQLRVQNFDLDRFVRKAKAIRTRPDGDGYTEEISSIEQWTEFGIAGINASSGYRAKIDITGHYISQDWLNNNREMTIIRHDFDSLLGRSECLPYKDAIEVYPLYGSGFRILKSLHIGVVPLDNSYVCHISHNPIIV